MNAQRMRSVGAQRRMTVFGVFDDNYLAYQAVSELCKAGFEHKHIAVASRFDQACIDDEVVEHLTGRYSCAQAILEPDRQSRGDEVGGGLPVFEQGAIARSQRSDRLSVASMQMGSAALDNGFRAANVPEHEAEYYRNEWKAGRTVVAVSSGGRSREALGILRRHGSYDMFSGIVSGMSA